MQAQWGLVLLFLQYNPDICQWPRSLNLLSQASKSMTGICSALWPETNLTVMKNATLLGSIKSIVYSYLQGFS